MEFKRAHALYVYVLCLFLAVAPSACSLSLPGSREAPSPEAAEPYALSQDGLPERAVQLIEGGLMKSQAGGAELGLTLANRLDQPIWVSIHFQTPGGATDCVLLKELTPRGDQFFVCPQPRVQAGFAYPVHIQVFESLNQAEPVETVDTRFRFTTADIQALGS